MKGFPTDRIVQTGRSLLLYGNRRQATRSHLEAGADIYGGPKVRALPVDFDRQFVVMAKSPVK
jgi:hypothetical protein